MKNLASLVLIPLLSACSASVIHGTTPDDTGSVAHDSGTPVDTGVTVIHDGAVPSDVTSVPPSSDGGTPCPETLAGYGLPCMSPGQACGTTSSDGCSSTSMSCVCSNVHTWQCVTSYSDCGDGGFSPPSLDGGIAPPPLEDAGIFPPVIGDGGACSLIGTWHFNAAAYPSLFIRFQGDGNWQVASTTYDLDGAAITGGTFTLTGSQIALVENLVAASPTACTATETGVYNLEFATGCVSLNLAEVSDGCAGRGAILGSTVLTPL